MERLTIAQPGGLYNIRPGYTWQAVAQRLAAYEDTGLEPEDTTNHFGEATIMKLASQALGTTPDRLRELAKADRGGRVVVLDERKTPCDLCAYNPPSSLNGKPCSMCPATAKEAEEALGGGVQCSVMAAKSTTIAELEAA